MKYRIIAAVAAIVTFLALHAEEVAAFGQWCKKC